MRLRTVIALTMACLVVPPVFAQHATHGFVTAGSVGVNDEWRPLVAAGGEAVHQHLSIGGELGLVYFRESGSRGSDRQPVIGVFASVRPGPSGAAFQPFGSLGLVLVDGSAGWQAGGGAVFWGSERVGVRTDIRIALPFAGEGGFVMARVGFAIR